MLELIVALWMQSPGAGCTYDNPYPNAINQVCTGYGYPGSSCKVNMISCSPIPGQPGTWNPNGYTVKKNYEDCK